ncbi:MAG: hypothetical protein QM627_03650 [Luteolibacter sp.]
MDSLASSPTLVELKCTNCGSRLSPAEISPHLAAARCSHCHALFALPTSVVNTEMVRPEVGLPKKMTLVDLGNILEITRKWRGAAAYVLIPFTLFWNGFMVVWHTISLSQGIWTMSLFGLLHTGVGLFLIYLVLAKLFNTTVVRVKMGRLTVNSGPIPWPGSKNLDASEVTQLFCKEKVTHNKNGSTTKYTVEAILKGHRTETLVSDLETYEQALFIEQQLEKHLKIMDAKVTGEHGR